jgi:TonB family protein
MSDHSLLYLGLPSPHLPQRSQRARKSVVVSLMLHVSVAAVLATLVVGTAQVATSRPAPSVSAERLQVPRIVFVPAPGPGGGGGGGGNRQPAPPSRAQGVGRDRLTLPVARPIVPSPAPADVAQPPQLIALNAMPLAAGTSYQIGMPEAASSLPFSQGPGSGGGVGEGTGTGIGPGRGPGLGPGYGGGFGGGAYRPGNNVSAPTLITQVRPNYTADAMRKKTQGTVILEVVVDCNGVPSAMRVERSLDPDGLDNEAMRAVKQWRFNPGRMGTTPVDVLVKIVLDFRIH